MNTVNPRKIVVDGQLTEASNVQVKVEQDIAFLQHRIALMKTQTTPNPVVLDTYENMLKSRKAVLSWLLEGATNITTHAE